MKVMHQFMKKDLPVAQTEGVHVLECQQHIMDDPAVLTRLKGKPHIGTKMVYCHILRIRLFDSCTHRASTFSCRTVAFMMWWRDWPATRL